MANIHCPATVNTLIPCNVVNTVDLGMLKAFGLDWELRTTQDSREYYFFAEEGVDAEGYLEIEDPQEFSAAIYGEFGDDAPDYVRELKAKVDAEIESGAEWVAIEVGAIIDVYGLLQEILNRDGWGNRPEYIEVMGATYCDKMRPDDFGGFSRHVYSDDSIAVDTWNSVRDMKALLDAGRRVVASADEGGQAHAEALTQLEAVLQRAA